jgi:hypothetical protein
VQIAGRLPSGGPALRAAAGTAFLHGMSAVMLGCAAVAAVAVVTSLRYLPGRPAPDNRPTTPAPADVAPDSTQR